MELNWQGKTDVLGKNRHSAKLCSTHLTKTGLGSNPRLGGYGPATHLAHGRAKCVAVSVGHNGTVARGTVTGTTGAYKDIKLFVSVRYVTVESRQGNPSKLIVAEP